MDAVSLKVVSKLVESVSRAQRLDACPEDVEEVRSPQYMHEMLRECGVGGYFRPTTIIH